MRLPCSQVSVDPQVLSRVGRELLARVQTVYADAGVALPERQLWTVGAVPYDCGMLAVSLSSLREGVGIGDAEVQRPCEVTVAATFRVIVVRCVPVPDSRGNPPTPERIAAAADTLATDAYLLMRSACKLDMWAAGLRPAPHPSVFGGMGVNATVEVEDASGGAQAVVLTLETVIS